jgi:hypothetical protein
VIVVWFFVLIAFLGPVWGAITSGGRLGPSDGYFFVTLLLLTIGLLAVGLALAAAAKRKGVNPTTWEACPEGQPVGKPDRKRRRVVMSELRQMIVEDPAATQFEGADLDAADRTLRSYHQTLEANWGYLCSDAAKTRTLPRYGEPPYWSNSGPGGRPVPLTCLAFWNTSDRLRAVRDSETSPRIISLATTDPDRAVAHAARSKIAPPPSD